MRRKSENPDFPRIMLPIDQHNWYLFLLRQAALRVKADKGHTLSGRSVSQLKPLNDLSDEQIMDRWCAIDLIDPDQIT